MLQPRLQLHDTLPTHTPKRKVRQLIEKMPDKSLLFHLDTHSAWAIDLSSSYFNKGHQGILGDLISYIDTLPWYIRSESINGHDVQHYFLDPYLEVLRGSFSAKKHNEVRSAIQDTLLS